MSGGGETASPDRWTGRSRARERRHPSSQARELVMPCGVWPTDRKAISGSSGVRPDGRWPHEAGSSRSIARVEFGRFGPQMGACTSYFVPDAAIGVNRSSSRPLLAAGIARGIDAAEDAVGLLQLEVRIGISPRGPAIYSISAPPQPGRRSGQDRSSVLYHSLFTLKSFVEHFLIAAARPHQPRLDPRRSAPVSETRPALAWIHTGRAAASKPASLRDQPGNQPGQHVAEPPSPATVRHCC